MPSQARVFFLPKILFPPKVNWVYRDWVLILKANFCKKCNKKTSENAVGICRKRDDSHLEWGYNRDKFRGAGELYGRFIGKIE